MEPFDMRCEALVGDLVRGGLILGGVLGLAALLYAAYLAGQFSTFRRGE